MSVLKKSYLRSGTLGYVSDSSGRMVFSLLLFVVGLALVVFLVPFFVFGKVVPPGSIGIRHNGYGLFGVIEKGYEKHGLEPGLHWRLPLGVSDIVLLPKGFQFINFNVKGGDLDLPQFEVPTSDGSKVNVDITLVVRRYVSPGGTLSETEKQNDAEKQIELEKTELGKPELGKYGEAEPKKVPFVRFPKLKHGGPQELVESYTTDALRQLKKFSIVAQATLTQKLFSLSTIQFYDPYLRERAALEAHAAVQKNESKKGIELWATLIRRYTYSQQNIDEQIFAKILQEQTERLNSAASKFSEKKAATEKVKATGDAEIQNLVVDGEAQVRVLRSEGDLYESKRKAEGDLLVAKARAATDQSRAQALNEIAGSRVYIAREMAPLLKTLKGGIVSGLDPYDIEEWVKKLTVGGEGKQQ